MGRKRNNFIRWYAYLIRIRDNFNDVFGGSKCLSCEYDYDYNSCISTCKDYDPSYPEFYMATWSLQTMNDLLMTKYYDEPLYVRFTD